MEKIQLFFHAYDAFQTKVVEPAFLNCGWRVDGKVVCKANVHIRESRVLGNLVKNSIPWINHPPIPEGTLQPGHDEVKELLRDVDDPDPGYDTSDDDYDDGGDGVHRPNGDPNGGQGASNNDSSDEDDNGNASAPGSSRIQAKSSQRSRARTGRNPKPASAKSAKKSSAKKSGNGAKKHPKPKKVSKGKGKGRAKKSQKIVS